jgi:hypothetical protein
MSDPWAFGWDQIAAFLNAIVIGVATWVAWRSVHDWREERLDARRAEVAEQALILAHQAIAVFQRIRTIGGFVGEGSSRTPEPTESPEETRRLNTAFVPIERIQKEARFFEQVEEIRPRVDAVFGIGHTKSFDAFLSMRWEIIGAAQALSGLRQDLPVLPEEQRKERLEEIQAFDRIVRKLPLPEDPIEERLKSAVRDVEKFARPLLESRLGRSPHP